MFLQFNALVMNDYYKHKEEILLLNSDVLGLIQNAQTNLGMSNQSFQDWNDACHGINRQLAQDMLRIAVIGTIKSGKSTFVNSLFRGDYLKRGAGVVTSIVTRIKKGDHLKAGLHFKSWDDVNSEMAQALTLLPNVSWDSETNPFDIRRESDRLELKSALDSLSSEQLITNDTRNVNSILLESYLRGYEPIVEFMATDPVTQIFEKGLFHEHRKFVGNDYSAVYLRDVQLEIGDGLFDTDIEIADCQGSDSPNPLHLAMIQDYLLTAHLLIYVISSRTGLRQADIRFLSMIKKMGILENTLFVVNCDFSEHDALDDLHHLNAKIREELSIITPKPDVFSFSALYNLFQSQNATLTAKDQLRMDQWNQEADFIKYAQEEGRRFESALQYQLTKKRYTLLLANHLKRLRIIISGMTISSRTHQDLFGQDKERARNIINKIAYHQKKMERVRDMIKSTLDGAIQLLKKDLKRDIDNYFDPRYGEVVPGIIDLIRNYQLGTQEQSANLTNLGFAKTLYLVYQDYKQTIDTYMAETVNPGSIGFFNKQEARISEFLESVAGPYNTMVKDAILEYVESMVQLGVELGVADYDKVALPDINMIKNRAGLHIPPAMTMMRYSARIKTDAFMRYGFYKILNAARRIFKRKRFRRNDNTVQALKDGLQRMKRETEASMLFHLKSYRENIKFQYLFKVVDVTALVLYDALVERFQTYHTDLSKISDVLDHRQADTSRLGRMWKDVEAEAEKLASRVNSMLKKVESV